MSKQQPVAEELRPILGDCVPTRALWCPDGARQKQMFASEASALWFIRNHRDELIGAKAICKHANQHLIHFERFEKVAEAVALRAVRRSPVADETAS